MLFSVVSLLALVAIASTPGGCPPSARLPQTRPALILGGAIGNLIDRVRLGYVVDFVHVYWKEPPVARLQRRPTPPSRRGDAPRPGHPAHSPRRRRRRRRRSRPPPPPGGPTRCTRSLLTLPGLRLLRPEPRPLHPPHLRLPARGGLPGRPLGRRAPGEAVGARRQPRHRHGGVGADRRPRRAPRCCCVAVDWRLLHGNPREILVDLPERRRLLRRAPGRHARSPGGTRGATRCPAGPPRTSLAPGVILGQAIGRLGCFAAGCCYGKPTNVPWAVTFTDVYAARDRGDADGRPSPPDPALRVGRGLPALLLPPLARRPQALRRARSFSPTRSATR